MVDIQFADTIERRCVPESTQLQAWVRASLPDTRRTAELCVRIVDETESQALNNSYRGKASPTNVLSFPAAIELPDDVELDVLGDIVICAPVVIEEACAQNKNVNAHWAHMIVHGVLHLCGYDHIDSDDAAQMESTEIDILTNLGFANPYEYPPSGKQDHVRRTSIE